MTPPKPAAPDLNTLVDLFYASPEDLGDFTEVTAADLPPAYARLLAHQEHMTVTVESFHGCPVDVRVLQTRHDDQHYARKILLTRQSDGRVVQFGVVRLDLNCLDADVQREILSQRTPLGRVLIEHNVLRQVQLTSLWRIKAGDDLRRLFDLSANAPHEPVVYGRTALIYCNGEPAVELLEIVTPV